MQKHPTIATLLRLALCATVFLLPLKFGSYIGGGEQANYPLNIWEWLFFSCYPAFLAPVLGGFCLVFACLVHGAPRADRRLLVPVLWCLPVLAGCISLAVTTEMDYAIQWLGHFTGAAALCLAVWWASGNDEKVLPWLLNSLAVVGLASCLHGWYQHCGGLAANREYLLQNAAQNGVQISELLLAKLEQTRIYGTFIDPNVYSAHLLFCMPFSLVALWRWGGRMEKPETSSRVLCGIGAILFLAALFWAGSRGAAIGAAAGLLAAALSLPAVRNWKWRWILPLLAFLMAGVFLLVITQRAGRGGFASASNRIIYYQAATQMYRQKPLAGVGLGEFFPHYLQLKPAGAEITRDPHNLFLSFLSQCGLPGGLAALLLLLFPWIALGTKPDSLRTAACTAMIAWFVHSLFQFNEIIPGTLYCVGIGGIFALEAGQGRRLPSWLRAVFLALGLLACFPLLRVPGEKLLQIAENENKQMAGAGGSYYEAAAEKLPHSAVPWKGLGETAVSQNNWQEAERCMDQLLLRLPHRASFHLRLAIVCMGQAKWDKAASELEAARNWFPWDPNLYPAMALLQYLQNNQTLSFQANALLQHILKMETWIEDKEGKVTVSFSARATDPITAILEKASCTTADGRTVHFRRES